jgi:hypothetical protein
MFAFILLAARAASPAQAPAADQAMPGRAAQAIVRIHRGIAVRATEWERAPRRRERVVEDESGQWIRERLVEFE